MSGKPSALPLLFAGMTACAIPHAECAAAEQYTAVPIPLENSRVGFTGDDSFITARLAYTPRHPAYLWRERLSFADGVIHLLELNPGRIFTQEGKWAESQSMVAEWKNEKYLIGKGLSITSDDVRQGSNRYGNYYYAIKENQNGKCGIIKQVFGYQSNDAGPQGNKRFNVLSCWVPANGPRETYEAFLLDIMTRIRADEGEINKAKAAALRNPVTTAPPASVGAAPSPTATQQSAVAPQPVQQARTAGGREVSFNWEGVGTSTGAITFDNLQGKGPLQVLLPDRKEPCTGFWVYNRGKYGTEKPPEGTWTLNCPNNLSAGGTYISSKEGEGSGTGADNSGRRITFTYTSGQTTQPKASTAQTNGQTPTGSNSNIESRLTEIERLYEKKLVTKDEYDRKRKEILSGL